MFSFAGFVGKAIRKIIQQDISYMAGQTGVLFFLDISSTIRRPVYVDQASQVAIEIYVNAWTHTNGQLKRHLAEAAKDIRTNENIDRIQSGDFASGLLRVALESMSKDLDIVELGGKHFEISIVNMEHEGYTKRYTSFQCLQSIQ